MVDIAQLDGFARQHAQRPVVMPFRHVAARKRDEMRLLRTGERLASPLLPLVRWSLSTAPSPPERNRVRTLPIVFWLTS